MKAFMLELLLFLKTWFVNKAAGSVLFVELYPPQDYHVEFSSVDVTCVAIFDSHEDNYPVEIVFAKATALAYETLHDTENMYFTNRTEAQGNQTKLYVTLHIKNITLNDSSSYFCSLGMMDNVTFSINVIPKRVIPKLLLGYDDYNTSFTTIQCIATEAEDPDQAIYIVELSLRKNNETLDLLNPPYVYSLPLIVSSDVSPGEKHNDNFDCHLLMKKLFDPKFRVEVVANKFTRITAPRYLTMVKPFPEDIHPIEFSSLQVTCAAVDSSGRDVPQEIYFIKNAQSVHYTLLTTTENLYFTNRTETQANETKLFVTLHIKNVSMQYDDWYACFVPRNMQGKREFRMTVIAKNKVPGVLLGYDDYDRNITTIQCVVIPAVDMSTEISKVELIKNGVVKLSLQDYTILSPTLTLDISPGERNSGNYTCLLHVRVYVRFYAVKSLRVLANNFTRIKIWPSLSLVEPFPGDVYYPIKFSSVEVTCVAFDPHGQIGPEDIKFVKFGDLLNTTENLYFTNRTETQGNKTKIFVTLQIKNVTQDDEGSYGCFMPKSTKGGKPFIISPISLRGIPKVVLGYDDYNRNITTIQCFVNATQHHFLSYEKASVSLMRNGVFLRSSEVYPIDSPSLSLDVNPEEKNSGNYTCLLELNLGPGIKNYHESSSTFTRIRVQTRKCYQCVGLNQQCSDENVSRLQVICNDPDDLCGWTHARFTNNTDYISMSCSSRQKCQKYIDGCYPDEEFMECCSVSCCDTDFCNTQKYSGGRFCKIKKNLVAAIFGGSVVIRGLNENLTMNGSLSYDPETGDNKGMKFSWYYGKLKRQNNDSIQLLAHGSLKTFDSSVIEDVQSASGHVITIDRTFAHYNQTIVVKLTVSKDRRVSNASQIVHFVRGDPPKISQRCLINCGIKVIPSVKLSTESDCLGAQCSHIVSYHWELYVEEQIGSNGDTVWRKNSDLNLLTSTALNSSVIVIKENSLIGGKNYRLALYVRTGAGLSGMSAYYFSTSLPPRGGRCLIEPASGTALKTNFTLNCTGWKSNNGPLSYRFQFKLGNGLNSVIYNGLNNLVISRLPSGDLNFTATVTDNSGASVSVVNLTVKVAQASNVSSETINRLVLANDSLLNEAINMDNLSKAAEIANTAIQAVAQDSALDLGEKTKVNEFIVDRITSLPVKGLPDLLQTSSVIASAINDTNTVSPKCLDDSLTSVDSMTSLMKSKAQTKNTTDMSLITKSAENLGSCLNNMLKVGAVFASGNSNRDQGISVVTQSMHIVSNVSDAVLELSLPDEEGTVIKTSDMIFALGRHTPSKLVGMQLEIDGGKFVLPADLVSRIANNSRFVDTQMLSVPFNPFTWSTTRDRVHSGVLKLELKDDKREAIKVFQLSKGIVIEIPLQNTSSSGNDQQFFVKNDSSRFHEIKVDFENTLIQLEISPEEVNAQLSIFMRFGHRPTSQLYDLNGTISVNERCIWTKIEDKMECSANGLIPIQIVAKKPGKYYVEVRSRENFAKPPKRQKRSCFGGGRQKRSCVEVKDPPPTSPESKNVTIKPEDNPSTDHNYTMRVAQGSCVYWSYERQMWTTEGCQILSASLDDVLNCSCNHLTSFGGSLLVKPNPIDFDKVLVEFKRLGETGNVAVIVTIAVVFMTYIVVVIMVRKADEKDAARRTFPAEQLLTSSSSSYEYEISITTGIWINAGTTAKVAMEIYGSVDSTGILYLNTKEDLDGEGMFSRGSTEVFKIALENSVGCVRGVRIGHDNSGKNPSWFLEDVVILEKHTLNSWTFSCSQWLALERGDGRIERVLEAQMVNYNFNREVLQRWLKGLTEKHMWVSIVAKPSRDTFTRVQRASCCLSMLLSALLTNAMFYKVNGASAQVIQIGPLKFSWRQVIVGIESALIVAPINLFIALLFKKGSGGTLSQQTPTSARYKWLVYVAWFLCFCTCAVSTTFTIFYSLVWEKSKSEQWLSSMVISLIQDVATIEPAKVFFVAMFLVTIIRCKRANTGDYSPVEETCQVSPKGKLWKMEIHKVEEMRKRQAKKQNVSRFFVELFVYCMFVIILMVMCYGNRNDHRYLMTKAIRDGVPNFKKVLNNTLYWGWLRKVFVPGVYAGAWYNGLHENRSIYIGDKCSVLVGMPRVRQLRVKKQPCHVLDYMKTMFPTCYYAYSKETEDVTRYNKPEWISVGNITRKDELERLCPKPWRYQTPAKTDTVPKWGQFSLYPGGGFVADLGYEMEVSLSIIDTLQRYGWLDLQSRPVILEFSAFNPATNLLVIATYFYEIRQSGYKAPSERFYTISIYSKETGFYQFYLICVLLFIIFVLLYLIRIGYTVYKQRFQFLKRFWNWIEIFQILFSVLAVVITIARTSQTSSRIREMRENVYENIDFQEVIAWTEAENGVLGILVFLVTFKLLRLIRYNEHVALLSRTLRASGKLLSSYMVVFLIGFMAFLHFGILIFEAGSVKYSTLLRGTYYQLELILGKVKKRPIEELANANRTFGKTFSGLMLFSLTIFFMNFFIAAINDALENASNSVIPNKLYDLVDGPGLDNDKDKRRFFDNISESIKRSRRTKEEPPELPNKDGDGDKPLNKCDKETAIDYDKISIAIAGLKQKRDESLLKPIKKRSFYDKVSAALKELRSAHSRGDDGSKLYHEELRTTEKRFCKRLDSIVQADYDEEETFHLLCHQIGWGWRKWRLWK